MSDVETNGDSALCAILSVLDLLKAILIALTMSLIGMIKSFVPSSMLPKKSVAQEIVLVTGAGSGIGRLLATKLARLGARLVLWDRDTKGNEETARMIRKENGEAHPYTIDLSKREEIYKLAEVVKKEVGEIDILVNNAGIVTGRRFVDCPDELIVKTMEVNAMAHFWTAKAFLPSMMQRNHGHIVSIASGAGLFGASDLADYCASKFAAVGFNESIGVEMDSKGYTGIYTTTVCPYYINTGMFDGVQTGKYLPILDADFAANKMVDAILLNQEMLLIPRALYFLNYLRGILPVRVGYYLGHFFGVTHSMDKFKGRQQQN